MFWQKQYYFSRVAAFTMIEAIFLLLISQDDERTENIKKHEEIISNQKIKVTDRFDFSKADHNTF
ncbi:hypothetical protein LABF186_15450 [Lactobacillus amylovorus subsp. animalium]|uniref:Uncharacterized protein n=1 Tax=Lactobacillus amylovorus subsp. animalium TaxID=3378536 RepID=A0ABD0C579_LACAM|nr:hypothetical protein LABF186_15450 [Lactobacillus amylovorus]GMM16404.1 hypothetical protein LABF125_15380 [Lactobacillus amylovorus]